MQRYKLKTAKHSHETYHGRRFYLVIDQKTGGEVVGTVRFIPRADNHPGGYVLNPTHPGVQSMWFSSLREVRQTIKRPRFCLPSPGIKAAG